MANIRKQAQALKQQMKSGEGAYKPKSFEELNAEVEAMARETTNSVPEFKRRDIQPIVHTPTAQNINTAQNNQDSGISFSDALGIIKNEIGKENTSKKNRKQSVNKLTDLNDYVKSQPKQEDETVSKLKDVISQQKERAEAAKKFVGPIQQRDKTEARDIRVRQQYKYRTTKQPIELGDDTVLLSPNDTIKIQNETEKKLRGEKTDYSPKTDDEKLYAKYIEKQIQPGIIREQRKKEYKNASPIKEFGMKTADTIRNAGAGIYSGMAENASNFYSLLGLNGVLGENVFTQLAKGQDQAAEQAELRSRSLKDNPDSVLNQIVDSTFKSVPRMVLDAVLAMMSGGATSANSLAKEALSAVTPNAATTGGYVISSLANRIGQAVKLPKYMIPMFVDQATSSYRDAVSDGKPQWQALTFGITNGYLNALLEGGGVEESFANSVKNRLQQRILNDSGNTLKKAFEKSTSKLSPALKEWANSTVEEGLEEVTQSITEKALRNIQLQENYGKLFRTGFDNNNENAYINLREELVNFAGGAFGGAAFGGINLASSIVHNQVVNTASKRIAVKNIDKEIGNTQKFISELENYAKSDMENKSGYAVQINGAKDYINDLNRYKANIKSKNPTTEANLATGTQYESISEFNPNYYDVMAKQYIRADKNENGTYTVKYFDGSYVTKTSGKMYQRYVSVENNSYLQNNLNALINEEKRLSAKRNVKSAATADNTANTDDAEVMYSVSFDENGAKHAGNAILNIVKNNIGKIPNNTVFDVSENVDISSYNKKSDYILDVFNKQGNIARNPQIGDVELNRSGAKSTVIHGFGNMKFATVGAIKSAIENGTIINHAENYNDSGVDRYIIAAKGKIGGEDAVIGVVVKTYPNGNANNKFYLHEAAIIKRLHPPTAPQSSVDTVGETAVGKTVNVNPNTSIPQNKNGVKENSAQSENVGASKGEKRHFNTDYAKSTVRELGQILGVNVEFSDNLGKTVDGMFYMKNGQPTIVISNESSDPIMTVFKHELTHSFKGTDPKAYAEYRKYVTEKLKAYNADMYNQHFNELWNKYCNAYNADPSNGRVIKTVKNENGFMRYVTDQNGMFEYDGDKRVTAEDIEDEIAARATESFLTDTNGVAFQKMAEKSPNAARGFINALRSMILRLVQLSQQIKKRFAGAFNTKIETEMLKADINAFREAERMFTDMIEGRYNANPNNASDTYADRSVNDNVVKNRNFKPNLSENGFNGENAHKNKGAVTTNDNTGNSVMTKTEYSSQYDTENNAANSFDAEKIGSIADDILDYSTKFSGVNNEKMQKLVNAVMALTNTDLYSGKELDTETKQTVTDNINTLRESLNNKNLTVKLADGIRYIIDTAENAVNGKRMFSVNDYASKGGYNGKSMSNRAVEAYRNGEKPLSKWTKTEILDAINSVAFDNDIDISGVDFGKLSLDELKQMFLKRSSWHHTGAFYNPTDFYVLDEETVANISNADIDEVIGNRKRNSLTADEKNKMDSNKAALKSAQETYRKLETILESGIKNVKSVRPIYNQYKSGKLDLEKTYAEAVERIKQRDSAKVEQWKSLPSDHWRQEYARLFDTDFNAYLNKNYNIGDTANNAIIQALKNDVLMKAKSENINNAVDEKPKFSLSDDTDTITKADIEALRNIPRKSINEFTSDEIKATEKFAKRYYKELGVKSPFFRSWFGDWRANDTTPIKTVPVDAKTNGISRGLFKNSDTGWDINVSAVGINDTVSHSGKEKLSVLAMNNIDSIIKNAVLFDSEVSEIKGKKGQNTLFMHKLYALTNIGNKPYISKLAIEEYGNGNDTSKRFYNLKEIKISPALGGLSTNNNADSTMRISGDSYSISDLFKFVKTFDKNFFPKEASKVVNEDGTPKVMYHGSPNEFTVFDKRKAKYSGTFGKAFYFSGSDAHAGTYGNLYKVYLNIKNPIDGNVNINTLQLKKFLRAVADNEDYSIENYGTYDIDEIYENLNKSNLFAALRDINTTAIGDFAEAVGLYNNINGTKYDGIISDTETVVFNPNQIKSATDNIGTFDNDNLDIRFSLSDTVEETKDLIAVHNLNQEKLEGNLELGGIPMPSIAVTKADVGHADFGDITLLFRKDTIDPKASKYNKLYGGDAYTPMFPTVDYKANSEVIDKISKKYSQLYSKYGYEACRALSKYADMNNAEDILNRTKGEKGLINNAKDDVDLMQTFLYDAGIGKIDTVEKTTKTRIKDAEADRYDYFIEKLGKAAFEDLTKREPGTSVFAAKKAWAEKYMAQFDKALTDYYSEKFGFSKEETSNILNAETTASKTDMAREILKYIRNGKETVKTEPDYAATSEKIRKTAKEHGYDEWVDKLFSGIEDVKGIYNGKDPYTPSGNRRSFAQLHDEYTLENVVNNMRKQLGKGQSSLFTGANSVQGAATKEYKSIDEMKREKGRISTLSQTEFDNIRNDFSDRLSNIIERACKNPEQYLNALNDFSDLIIEGLNKTKTPAAFRMYLTKEGSGFYNITKDVCDDVLSLVNDMREVPVKYFEAKPQRAIDFNEVEAVIVPNNTDESFINRLKDKGLNVVKYGNGENDRINTVNEVADKLDVKFSLADDVDSKKKAIAADAEEPKKLTDSDKYIIDKIVSDKKNPLSLKEEKAYKRLEDTNKLLREHFKLTPGEKVTEEHALKLAKKYVKQYGLVYDTADYADKIKEVINHEAENSKNNTSEYNIFEELQAVNAEMLENAKALDTSISDQYKDLAARLKKGVKVTDDMKSNITDYKDFKSSIRNSMPLKTNSDVNVDVLYQELTEEYPELFSNDIINPTDRLFRLAEVSQAIKPQIVTPEYGTSSINDVANIITAEMLTELTPQTKMGKRVNELKYKLGETKRAMKNQAAHLKREGDLRVAFAVDKEAAKLDKYKAERKNQAAREYLFKALDNLSKMNTQSINNEKFDSARKSISDEIAKINTNIENDTEKLKGELSEKERSDTERHLTWLKNMLEKKSSALKNLGGMKENGVDFETQKSELVKRIAAVAQANIDSAVSEINSLIAEQNKKISEFKEKLGGDLPQDKLEQLGKRIKALEARRDRLIQMADKKQNQGGDNLNIYKALKDTDVDTLQDFAKDVINLQNDIRIYGKALKNAKTSDLYLVADKIAREQENYAKLRNGNKNKQDTLIAEIKKHALFDVLSPMRVARMISGYNENSELMRVFNDIDKGQEDVRKFKYQANKLFEDSFKKADISLIDTIQKLSGRNADTVDIEVDGKKYKITKGMRVSLYLHSLNETNMFHIEKGGIIIPDIKEFKKGHAKEAFSDEKRSKPLKLTGDEVNKIISGMSKEEKIYAITAHKFFNVQAKNAINARSEYLVGYDIADVADYFPIVTERTVSDVMLDNNPLLSNMYMNSKGEYKEDMSGIASIEGRGEYKSRVKGASNPIMLEDAYSVVKRHIRNTAQYYGMSMPLRNLTEILNTFTISDGRFKTVSAVLEQNWGTKFTTWLTNLRKDLNFGRRIDDDTLIGRTLDKIPGKYAGAVLTGNLSVILKQTASYPTAIAELGSEAVSRGFADMSKITDDFINSLTGIYAERGNGLNDVSFEEILRESPLVQKSPTILRSLAKGIETADKITVKKLFKAAMWSVKLSDSKYKSMDMKEAMKLDDFKAKVVDAYIRTVENTQPMYDTMQRNALQRSPNGIVRSLFPFMTQRFQNLGIMIDAVGNYKAKRLAYKANRNDTTKAAVTEARKRFVWAVQSRLIANVMMTGINALWKLLRDRVSEWKGDDGETDKSKVLAWSIDDFFKNNIGDIPFGSVVYDVATTAGKLIANSYLDKIDSDFKFDTKTGYSSVDEIELANISMLNEIVQLPLYFIQNGAKKTVIDNVASTATVISRAVGFPADSVKNIYLVTLNTIRQGMEKLGMDTTEYDFRIKSLEWKINEQNAGKFYEYSNKAFLNYLKSGKKSDLKIYTDISNELEKGGISKEKIETKAYKYAFGQSKPLKSITDGEKYFNRLLKYVEMSTATSSINKTSGETVKKFVEAQYSDFEKVFNSEMKNIAKDKGVYNATKKRWENSGASMIKNHISSELKSRLRQYYGYTDKDGNKKAEAIQSDFDKYVKLFGSRKFKEAEDIAKHLVVCGYASFDELKEHYRKNK